MASEDELLPVPLGNEAFVPPVQKIAEAGWGAFLGEWDKRASALIRATDLRYGLGLTPSDDDFFKQKLHDAHVQGFDAAFAAWPTAVKDNKVLEAKGRERAALLREAAHRITPLLPGVRQMNWDFWSGEQSISASPASVAAVAEAERRLNHKLPPSYRSFLELSNGWLMSTPLAAVEEAAWLRDKKPDLAQALSYRPSAPAARHYAEGDYLTYGRGMKVNMFLPEYANDLLLVSGAADWSECDILLNPKVITAEGEWEAGYWDPKGMAGVARFSSFAHLMEWLYLCEIAGLGERQRLTAESFVGRDTGSARG